MHEALVVVDHCIDDTVSDGFGNDLFCLFNGIEAQFSLDVLHGDLGIGDVELLQTEFEDGVLQSHDQGVVLVGDEDLLVLGQNLLEGVHVSRFYAVDDLEVWGQRLLEEGLGEDLSVRNFTHEKLDDNLEFLDLDSEGFGADLRGFSQRLDESGLRLGVLELHGLDSAQVVQVSRILIIGHVLREGGLDRELASWLIKILSKVRSQNDVRDGSLANEVLSEARSLVRLKHHLPDLWKLFLFFICNGDKIHGLGTQMIERPEVDILESGEDEISKLFRRLVIAIVDELH